MNDQASGIRKRKVPIGADQRSDKGVLEKDRFIREAVKRTQVRGWEGGLRRSSACPRGDSRRGSFSSPSSINQTIANPLVAQKGAVMQGRRPESEGDQRSNTATILE